MTQLFVMVAAGVVVAGMPRWRVPEWKAVVVDTHCIFSGHCRRMSAMAVADGRHCVGLYWHW